MPQRDVFRIRLRLNALRRAQSADLLAVSPDCAYEAWRTNLFCLFAEVLLGFAHFGALQVADFRAILSRVEAITASVAR